MTPTTMRRPGASRGAALGCAALALAGIARAGENRPPVVAIVAPADGSAVGWDRAVPYEIRVADPEDGETRFDEIPWSEIHLEVQWLPGATLEAARAAGAGPDSPGLALMKTSNCFDCHAVDTRTLGPPFAEIAARHAGDPEVRSELARRVREGSVGRWGDMPMLPHPDLSDAELGQMLDWVLGRAAEPDRAIHSGPRGSFRTRPDPGPGARLGSYRLTATYTDHGAPGTGQARRTGRHTIALRSPAPGGEDSREN